MTSAIYSYGKIGDATKEVNRKGTEPLSSTASGYTINNGCIASMCNSSSPFILRGGYCGGGSQTCQFEMRADSGSGSGTSISRTKVYYEFRCILIP